MMRRLLLPVGSGVVILSAWICFASSGARIASAQSLGIPKQDAFGQPIDVGLLILGHSTSLSGDWPGKLAQTLNANPNGNDGRNYIVFSAITGGDGGFLWTQLFFPKTDREYNRVLTSPVGQWCEDNTGVRWSCRRAKLKWVLTGQNPLPPECDSTSANPIRCEEVPPLIGDQTMQCAWHENGAVMSQALGVNDCWTKMDVRLALIQDTSNRSWPVDDYTGDGAVDSNDYFNAASIAPAAWPCPTNSGNPSGVVTSGGKSWIDWRCDNTLSSAEAAVQLYAGWLEKVSLDTLDSFGTNSVNHVFLTQKPVEMTSLDTCATLFPNEPNCGYHTIRAPTPSRPFDHFYLSTVYWEYRAIETLFAKPALDPRIHKANEADVKQMWNRSAQCYASGIFKKDWTIPPSPRGESGRPTVNISADDTEIDSGPRANADTVGCMLDDHIHHNDDGGWMMGDVWYSGLLPYLQ